MQNVISFLSPIGGVGQSALLMHLAMALAARGKSTVLLDLSPTAPSLDILGEVAESVVYTFSDVAGGLCAPSSALLSPPFSPVEGDGALISILPISVGEEPSGTDVDTVVHRLKAECAPDFILMDASPALYKEVCGISEKCFLLTDARPSSLRASEVLGAKMREENGLCRFLLLGAPLVKEFLKREISVIDMIDRLALPIGGIVPNNDFLPADTLSARKRHRKDAYVCAIANIASRLLGESVPLLKDIPLEGMSRRYYLERTTAAEAARV